MLVSTGRDLTELVRPPRAMFVNFPMGNPFGPPNDAAFQRRVLRQALELASTITDPGQIVDLADEWPTDFSDKVSAALLAM